MMRLNSGESEIYFYSSVSKPVLFAWVTDLSVSLYIGASRTTGTHTGCWLMCTSLIQRSGNFEPKMHLA